MIPPDTVDIGICSRCESNVRYVGMPDGKQITVQVTPAQQGRLTATYDANTGRYVAARFLLPGEICGGVRFDPHSDWCRRLQRTPTPPPADVMAQIRADIRAAQESNNR